MSSNVITIEENFSNNGELLRILLNDPYFDMLKKIIKSDSYSIIIKTGDTSKHISISALIRQYDPLLFDEETDDKTFDRILSLRALTSIDQFIAKYKNRELPIQIDDFSYKIKFNSIIECLLLSENDYKLFLNGHRDNRVPIDVFLYATSLILRSDKIMDQYVLPDSVIDRINSIIKSSNVDIEAINQISNTTDCRLKDVYVDPNFRNEILRSIPRDMSQLEKAIYLYILLCRTLTYDPVFFAYEQKKDTRDIHKSIDYLAKINKRNNKVVCYEFNSLYGYFLNELGIHYETSYKENDPYGRHASLTFRVDKYIVSADSVTSILSGDLVNAKTDHKLNGLVCINNNSNTIKEFTETRDRIQAMFRTKSRETFLRAFRETVNYSKLPLDQKVVSMVKKANDKKLAPMDTLGYILKLKRETLSSEEQDDFSYIIVRYSNDIFLPLRAIITTKVDGEYKYFIYMPGFELKQVDKELISDMFVLNQFEYLADDPDRVPGIHEIKEEDHSFDLLGDYGKILRKLIEENK